MRSIILEGFDGGGKSTLAFRLSNHFKLKTYTAGPPARDDKHAIECCEDQLDKIKEGYVLDRVTPISRLCYQEGLKPGHVLSLCDKLDEMKNDAVVIWCKPDKYIHKVSPHDTQAHLADIKAREVEIMSSYDNLMSVTPHTKFNWSTTNFEQFVVAVEYLMER